jgi:hypothetical protein
MVLLVLYVHSTILTKGKTQYAIDTWSYQYGLQIGFIPSDVSNASTFVYPLLDNGCVDSGYNYTAPSSGGYRIIDTSMGVFLVVLGLYFLGICSIVI